MKVNTVCECGAEQDRRVSDLLHGVKACRSCSSKAASDHPNRVAAIAKRKIYVTPYDKELADTGNGAKKRCTNKNNSGFKNYGGRGIEFRFNTVQDFVVYVKSELPVRKSGETIDRIDNDGHYERGNLRWATRTIQRLNQRHTQRANPRVDVLHEQRPDMSREAIRRRVAVIGCTNECILNRPKHKHCNGECNQ